MPKNGKPLTPKERATRTNTELVQNINRSIRRDWGGQDYQAAISSKLHSNDKVTEVLSSMSELHIGFLLNEINKIVCAQVEGIRDRTHNDREELISRFSGLKNYSRYAPVDEILAQLDILEKAAIKLGSTQEFINGVRNSITTVKDCIVDKSHAM